MCFKTGKKKKTKTQEKKTINPYMIQILLLSDRDFKITMVNLIKKMEKMMYKIDENITSTEYWNPYKLIKWTFLS